MAIETANIPTDYPIPVYRFTVDCGLGAGKLGFTEVSGLDIGVETITYKDGLKKIHMPGQPTDITITLKRGLVRNGSGLYEWLNTIKGNQVEKRDITISLLEPGETDKFIITWNVSNAFPKKLTAPSFNGSSNEASIEQLELMADNITIDFISPANN